MTMAHLLEADHISKYYGNIVALNGISVHVDAGEVTCILGDNGKPLPIVANALIALRRAPELRDLFAFDQMARLAMMQC